MNTTKVIVHKMQRIITHAENTGYNYRKRSGEYNTHT